MRRGVSPAGLIDPAPERPITPDVCIVGGGPAGLRAAGEAAGSGARVRLFESMPSPGRKFLVAGRGGLNITNTARDFSSRYSGPGMPPGIWEGLLEDFNPEALQAWASSLGVPTFASSGGRVYPEGMKSAPLLRRWIASLRSMGVKFFPRHRLVGWRGTAEGGWCLSFLSPDGEVSVEAGAVVFALGGASWPVTGSDGGWQKIFSDHGIRLNPLEPANCGWETAWPEDVLRGADGLPLKNVMARAAGSEASGELLITSYGLEGGVIYALTPALRAEPVIEVDFKPPFSAQDLLERLPGAPKFHLHEALERCRIQPAARILMSSRAQEWTSREAFVAGIKKFRIPLRGPRPIAEAISSAGGVCWDELDARLMLKNHPGLFVAGEMIDWEAPTGGFLMQGCFCTGKRAGRSAAGFA